MCKTICTTVAQRDAVSCTQAVRVKAAHLRAWRVRNVSTHVDFFRLDDIWACTCCGGTRSLSTADSEDPLTKLTSSTQDCTRWSCSNWSCRDKNTRITSTHERTKGTPYTIYVLIVQEQSNTFLHCWSVWGNVLVNRLTELMEYLEPYFQTHANVSE